MTLELHRWSGRPSARPRARSSCSTARSGRARPLSPARCARPGATAARGDAARPARAAARRRSDRHQPVIGLEASQEAIPFDGDQRGESRGDVRRLLTIAGVLPASKRAVAAAAQYGAGTGRAARGPGRSPRSGGGGVAASTWQDMTRCRGLGHQSPRCVPVRLGGGQRPRHDRVAHCTASISATRGSRNRWLRSKIWGGGTSTASRPISAAERALL